MALAHANVQVNTTPTQLVVMPGGVRYTAVSIQNTHSAAIFIGDKSVTTSGATIGHSVAAGATYQVWLGANDSLYAISVAQTAAGAVSLIYSGL